MATSRYDQALSDPHSVFGSPDEVLADSTLSPQQKRAVLERWHGELSRTPAIEDDPGTGQPPSLLQRVGRALANVDTETGTRDDSPPTGLYSNIEDAGSDPSKR